MLTDFLLHLKAQHLPVSTQEFLALLQALQAGVIAPRLEEFYLLARTTLVKDEAHFDRFDRAFGQFFAQGPLAEDANPAIPVEWLQRLIERVLSEAEKAQLQKLGWEGLMHAFRERLEEQKEHHSGGARWIGSGGSSPFGAQGYHPEGLRFGAESAGHQTAVKVWERREFRNLDDTAQLGTRNIAVALRRLRRFARTGAAQELDLAGTIHATARNAGYLDLKLRPERHNAVKVLLFVDVGGSMDAHVKICQEMFAACRSEFKHLEYFYFHNCIYESVWRDNQRRFAGKRALDEVLHTYGPDYKLILVGDASMNPYEITFPGGSVEHANERPGSETLRCLLDAYPAACWLNPLPEMTWRARQSVCLIQRIMGERMFPLTPQGIERAMRQLSRKH